MILVVVASLLLTALLTVSVAAEQKLVVWGGWSTSGEALAALAPEFEKANPGVKVEVQVIAWEEMHKNS